VGPQPALPAGAWPNACRPADQGSIAMLRTDRTRLYVLDLATGRATLLGPIGDGAPVRSIAIEP